MHRLTTSWLGIGVSAAVSWGAFSCGAPAELDSSLYPGPNETGYADDDGTGTTNTPLGGASSGSGGQAPSAGSTSGSGSSAAGGTGATSSPPPAASSNGSGGAAAPSGGGTTPSTPSSTPAAGAGATPAGGGAAPGGCPDDITVLFDRPITEGGCNGAACHVPGATEPDLVSPGVETRLLNVMSQCNGRPYIGAGDSFLADKIAGSPPECGLAMPFFMPQALSAADEQCILDWIEEVSGG